MKEMAVKVVGKNGALSMPADAFVKMANAYFDYQKTCAVEQTKRAQIEAWRQTTVKAIDTHFSQIKQWSTEQHEQKMLVLKTISLAIQTLGNQVPPEVLANLTQNMVDVVKEDQLPSKIQSLPLLSVKTDPFSNHISDDDIIDI